MRRRGKKKTGEGGGEKSGEERKVGGEGEIKEKSREEERREREREERGKREGERRVGTRGKKKKGG